MTDETERRFAALEAADKQIRKDIEDLKRTDAAILAEIGKIEQALAMAATKADMLQMKLDLSGEFHKAINGILKDALQAVPGKYMLLFMAVSAVIGAAGAFIAWLHG